MGAGRGQNKRVHAPVWEHVGSIRGQAYRRGGNATIANDSNMSSGGVLFHAFLARHGLWESKIRMAATDTQTSECKTAFGKTSWDEENIYIGETTLVEMLEDFWGREIVIDCYRQPVLGVISAETVKQVTF